MPKKLQGMNPYTAAQKATSIRATSDSEPYLDTLNFEATPWGKVTKALKDMMGLDALSKGSLAEGTDPLSIGDPSGAVMHPAFLGNKVLREIASNRILDKLKSLGPEFEHGAEMLGKRYPRILAHVTEVKPTVSNPDFLGATYHHGKLSALEFNTPRINNRLRAADLMGHELNHVAQGIGKGEGQPYIYGAFNQMNAPEYVQDYIRTANLDPTYAKYYSNPYEISSRDAGARNMARVLSDENIPGGDLKNYTKETSTNPKLYFDYEGRNAGLINTISEGLADRQVNKRMKLKGLKPEW